MDIPPLSMEAKRCLNAAQGWLDLGNPEEAIAELAQLPPDCNRHPDVLQARWLAAAKQDAWASAEQLAGEVRRLAPDRRFGWLHGAMSLRRLDRIAEARELLLAAKEHLAPSATLSFYLACYCTQLGKLAEAGQWLEEAFQLADAAGALERLRDKAQTEPDLAPWWTTHQRRGPNP